jgi:hypothetical protein
MSQPNVEILFFAKSRDLIGLNRTSLQLQTDQLSGYELLEILINNYSK